MLLFELARHGEAALTRDLIVRNFIARADTMVRDIFRLWEIEDYGDCWIIHRALLDRLFHLHNLNDKDQFDLFDDWSFKMQYEAANRLPSDPALKGQLKGLVRRPRNTDVKNREGFMDCLVFSYAGLILRPGSSTLGYPERGIYVRLP